MTQPDKPAPLALPDRLADLQAQRARLGGMQAQLEQQLAVVREQGLRCEGAIQLAQLLLDESKASQPKADPAPPEPASS